MVNENTYGSAEKASHLKQISKLTWENKRLKDESERYKKYWKKQLIITENLRANNFDIECEKDEIKKQCDLYLKRIEELEARINVILGDSESHDKLLQAKIEALENALSSEKAKANNDGTNSGIPTSQTPYNKKKAIPNSRVKSNRKRGGQPGHVKHTLAVLSEKEITERIKHFMENCPNCNSANIILVGERYKDVIDYEVVVKKVRHIFYEYKCLDCGRLFHSPIPLSLKEPIQYGSNTQALGLALQDIGFVSINRSRSLINGIIGNGLRLSEGYLCKLQKRYSKALASFVEDVRLECIRSNVLHWDDTTIFINTTQGCMRFYGNEKIALYKAHEKKDRAGIDEDKVLGALGPETTVVHDHLTMNYNEDFHFRNAECIQHLLRDIQKVYDISHHSWAKDMKQLISQTIHERNQLVDSGDEGFTNYQKYTFFKKLNDLLDLAKEQHKEAKGKYYEDDERRLITRIIKYQYNHFIWVEDFTIPPSNNLSERSLRLSKIKLRVSGQFQSVKTASYFADIRTYTETCYRHGVNVYDALVRLTSGNPYTLKELKGEA